MSVAVTHDRTATILAARVAGNRTWRHIGRWLTRAGPPVAATTFARRCSVTQRLILSGPLTGLDAKEPPEPGGEPACTGTGLLLSPESFDVLGLLVVLDLAL
jgi:hypothetical protein